MNTLSSSALISFMVPVIRAFWPETGSSIHVDGWHEVNQVEDYRVKVALKYQDGM